mgnify:CR=1 FL=1
METRQHEDRGTKNIQLLSQTLISRKEGTINEFLTNMYHGTYIMKIDLTFELLDLGLTIEGLSFVWKKNLERQPKIGVQQRLAYVLVRTIGLVLE